MDEQIDPPVAAPPIEPPPAAARHSLSRRAYASAETFVGVTVPFAGLVTAIVLTWGRGFSWVDCGLLVGMFLLTMTGVTVGFHRLFTHRSFQTVRPIQFVLGALGSMTFQGPLVKWVGLHRLHHRYTDGAGDPHSPHPHGPGVWGLFRGFWHAHVGWAFAPMPDGLDPYTGDLRRDRMIRLVSTLFPLWAVLGLLIPAAIGFAFGGWPGALTGFLWGGLVRVLLGHHATWCVNSVCHLWGRRPYHTADESRNNLVIGMLALGEGWHNNHHAFPSSARQGLRWWQIDTGFYLISLLSWLGLAWRVRVPTVEARAKRAESATDGGDLDPT